ncbi:tetratricopeptide repeat protein [Verrucomicrobiota bacterium]
MRSFFICVLNLLLGRWALNVWCSMFNSCRIRTYRVLCFVFLLCMVGLPGLAQTNSRLPLTAAASQGGESAEKGSDLLAEGRAALEDELYKLAQENFEALLEKGAGTPGEKLEYALLLTQALYGREQYQEMLDLLQQYRDQASGTVQADALVFWLASAHFELGQWAKVLDSVRQFEQDHSDSPYLANVIRLQAWSYERLGKQEEAIAHFARFADKYGQSDKGPSNLLDWGKALLTAGRSAECRDVLERLLALNLENRVGHECRIRLGRLYMQEGNLKKARLIVEPLTGQKQVPDDFRAMAVYAMVEIAEAQTNLVEALSVLDKGIAQLSDPARKGKGKLRKGKLLLKMGKIDEGIALVRDFVLSQGTNSLAKDMQIGLAQTLLAMGNDEKALKEYQNFLETFSGPEGVADAHEGKGWALFMLGRYHESAASFEKACELLPGPEDKARCRFKVGDCHFAGGQFKTAVQAYERVMAQCPETPLADQALFQKADCRTRLGQTDEAEALFWELIDKDAGGPLAGPALLRIAKLKKNQGKWSDARAAYTLVFNDYGEEARAKALHGMGEIHYRLGNFREALNRFEEVIESFPDSEVADVSCYMCGWCLYMLRRDQQAVNQFREFIKKYPKSPWVAHALFWMSEYDYNRGGYDLAEAGFMTVVRDYPKSTLADTALFWAGRAALMRKEFRRANDHFALLVKDYPASHKRAEARFYQGEALCELGEFAGAILIFDEIIKQFPESYLAEKAWFRKGDSQFTLGSEDRKRYDEAIASYRTVNDRPEVSSRARMQAGYKIGRCQEKLGRPTEAFEYYIKVVYTYFRNQDRDPQSNVWFTRAAFNAAEMKEQEKSWAKAVNIYQRVVDADVPAKRDAQQRINKIRMDHWLFFY